VSAVVKDFIRRPASDGDAPKNSESRAENFSWEIDRAALAARSERRAWGVAGVSIFITVIAIAAVFVQGPLRRIETVALVVDKVTGETTIANKLDVDTIPAVDALDMHNAEAFVRAREGYNWMFLQRDYDQVARMATPEVFGAYNKQFDPPNGLDKRLGSQGMQLIDIVGTRLPATGRTGNVGEAIVTFNREIRSPSKPVPEITRFVATMRFEYRPRLLAKAKDRTANPFGFVVTAYRVDEEYSAVPAATVK
jgi:type IV secretion system protein VirB8